MILGDATYDGWIATFVGPVPRSLRSLGRTLLHGIQLLEERAGLRMMTIMMMMMMMMMMMIIVIIMMEILHDPVYICIYIYTYIYIYIYIRYIYIYTHCMHKLHIYIYMK